MIRFVLSAHAGAVMSARSISSEWVGRVLDQPERIEPDAEDPELLHALGRIPEHGGRVLRVVYNRTTDPVTVVTAYFDRKMRDKL